MITLFLLERAWTLSDITPEEKITELQEQEMQRPQETKREIDTGQTWKCPICGDEFHTRHIDTDRASKHSFKKSK